MGLTSEPEDSTVCQTYYYLASYTFYLFTYQFISYLI